MEPATMALDVVHVTVREIRSEVERPPCPNHLSAPTMTGPVAWRQDFKTFQEAFNTGQPEIIVDILWERAQERARQKAARAAGTDD